LFFATHKKPTLKKQKSLNANASKFAE